MSDKLPSFDKPPVVEVVMGVQFQSLDAMLAPHVGLFWETVKAQYDRCSEKGPIPSPIEHFGGPGGVKVPAFELRTTPSLPRLFFEPTKGPWLIQLQRDRFLHNWRYYASNEAYPRYPAVRATFFAQWSNFKKFVDANNLGPIRMTQLEITYLNHIQPWTDNSDIGEVFPDFRWRTGSRLLGRPEECNVSFAFTSADKLSRLRATVTPGVHPDKGRLLLFELTVRGRPTDDDLEGWFDAGRRWIVTAFADLTSDQWHQRWGRTQ